MVMDGVCCLEIGLVATYGWEGVLTGGENRVRRCIDGRRN